jgi:hypothetical protein
MLPVRSNARKFDARKFDAKKFDAKKKSDAKEFDAKARQGRGEQAAGAMPQPSNAFCRSCVLGRLDGLTRRPGPANFP